MSAGSRPESEKASEAAERDAVIRTTDCPVCRAVAGERCLNTVTGFPTSIVHGGRATRWLGEGKRS